MLKIHTPESESVFRGTVGSPLGEQVFWEPLAMVYA
jgi:hypothetical protein